MNHIWYSYVRPLFIEVMIIRQANLSDARAIATVHVTSWQVIYRGLVPDSIRRFID